MLRPVSFLAAACMALAIPVAALADKPDHAGKPHKHQGMHHKDQHANGKPRAERRVDRDPVVVVGPSQRQPVVRVEGRACPPGLAKKNPPCVPPGQAKKAIGVGDVIDWNGVHAVTRPGLYGLGDAPRGQRYAIVNGRLVRVDRETGRILSILRLVDAILD